MAEEKMTSVEAVFKAVEGAPPDLLRELLEVIVTRVMGAEVSALGGAGYGERSAERVNTRNGYRSRLWDTRLGTIDLAIPKLRQGSYFPTWLLEPRRRAERALVAVVAESYVLGVSTRKVEDLVQTLGIAAMSKSQVSELAKSLDATVTSFRERPLDGGPYPYVWLDAMTLRCREGGRTVHVAALVAVGECRRQARSPGARRRDRRGRCRLARVCPGLGRARAHRRAARDFRRARSDRLEDRHRPSFVATEDDEIGDGTIEAAAHLEWKRASGPAHRNARYGFQPRYPSGPLAGLMAAHHAEHHGGLPEDRIRGTVQHEGAV
jgi:hypothetical protein